MQVLPWVCCSVQGTHQCICAKWYRSAHHTLLVPAVMLCYLQGCA
jgi:hypothetical protein